jgi:hypothetical protein
VIVAAAAVLALATPSRDVLVQRWMNANPVNTLVRLNSGPPAVPSAAVPDLRALAQREFAVAGRYQLAKAPPPHASLWSRFWSWIGDRLEQLWRTLFGRAHVGPRTAANIGDALLVVLVVIVLYVLVRLLGSVQLARSRSLLRSEPLDERPSPLALYNLALAAANAGDYGAAALLLFAATVALLDGKGAVELTSSSTVGDLRRALRKRDPALVDPFDAVAAPFVQCLYAERSIDAPQWQHALTAFDRLEAEGSL